MFQIRYRMVVLLCVGCLVWIGSGVLLAGCSPAPTEEPAQESTSETVTTQDGGTNDGQSGSENPQNQESTNQNEPVAETTPDASVEPTPEMAPEPPAESSGALSYAQHIQPILQKNNCTSGYCHGGGRKSGGLSLDNGYDNLVNKKSQSGAWTRVVPGDRDKSLLYEKVAQDSPAEGSRMPQGGQLSADDIQTIGDWIQQGAKP